MSSNPNGGVSSLSEMFRTGPGPKVSLAQEMLHPPTQAVNNEEYCLQVIDTTPEQRRDWAKRQERKRQLEARRGKPHFAFSHPPLPAILRRDPSGALHLPPKGTVKYSTLPGYIACQEQVSFNKRLVWHPKALATRSSLDLRTLEGDYRPFPVHLFNPFGGAEQWPQQEAEASPSSEGSAVAVPLATSSNLKRRRFDSTMDFAMVDAPALISDPDETMGTRPMATMRSTAIVGAGSDSNIQAASAVPPRMFPVLDAARSSTPIARPPVKRPRTEKIKPGSQSGRLMGWFKAKKDKLRRAGGQEDEEEEEGGDGAVDMDVEMEMS